MNRVRFARITRVLVVLALIAGLSASLASAATYTWNGGSSTDWSNSLNWSLSLPGSADVALFNSSTPYANQPAINTTAGNIGGLWYNGGNPLTVSGSLGLTLNGAAILSNTGVGLQVDDQAGALTVVPNVTLGAAQQWINNNSANPVTISGAVNNNGYNLTVAGSGATAIGGIVSGSGGLIYTGSGLLSLTAVNTFSGPLTVSGGTVAISAATSGYASALGNGYNTVTVNQGATLLATSNGRTCGYHSANVNLNGGTITFNTSDNSFASGHTLTFDVSPGTINGSGQLRIRDSGNQYIVNSAASGSVISVNEFTITGVSANFTVNRGTAPVDLLISSIIDQNSSGLGLTLNGNGIMALTGINSYTGATTISGGTLQMGDGGSLSTSSAIVNNSVLAFNYSGGNPIFVANNISGAGMVAVTGPGGVVLGGANTYSGGTIVACGTLSTNSASALGSGPVTVVPGALLDVASYGTSPYTLSATTLTAGNPSPTGAADINGSLTLPAGATLAVAGGSVGTLTVAGGLSLNNAAMAADFASGTSDLVSLTGGNALTLNGTTLIKPTGWAAAGTYTLFTYGSLSGTGTVALGGAYVSGRQSPSFDTSSGTALKLTLSGGSAAHLTWSGTASNVWDTQATVNWLNTGTGNGDQFYLGDMVTFDDSGSTKNISISGTVQPSFVTFSNNSSPYTLGGPGSIGGGVNLTINGSGGVTLSSSNSYTGGTTVTGAGVLTLSASNAVGSGPLTINGGLLNLANSAALGSATLNLGGGTLANASGGSLTLAQASQIWKGNFTVLATNGLNLGASPVALANSATATVTGGTLTARGVISGSYPLTIAGNGTTVLAGNSTYTGGTIISGGLVIDGISNTTSNGPFGAVNVSSTAITIQSNATLDLAGRNNGADFKYGLTISGSGTSNQGALINSGANGSNGNIQCPNITLAADAAIGGSGNIYMLNGSYAADTLTLNNHTLTKTGANTFYLVTTTVTAGTLNILQGTVSQFNSSGNASAADFILGPSGTLVEGVSGLSIGSLSGNGGTVSLGSNTLTVGGNNNSPPAFAGSILGTGGLTKTGNGLLTLSGSNTYSGTTTVSAGTLQVAGANAMKGGGAVSVGGGVLDLHGNSFSSGAATLTSGGILDSIGGGTLTATGYTLQGGTASASLAGASAAMTVNSTGTVVLTAGNTFGGGTTISAGTLAVRTAGGLGSGSLKINPGAALDISSLGSAGYALSGSSLTAGNPAPTGVADINGSIALPSAGTLSVAGGSVGTLTIAGSLALNGATMPFDLGSGSNDLVKLTGGGALSLNGITSINPTSWLPAGTYTVFTYGSLVGGAGNLAMGGNFTYARQPASFDVSSGTAVTMTVSGPGHLIWAGTASNVWDTNATVNWLNTGTGNGDQFYPGDAVTFDDSSSTSNVSISGTVQPFSVTFGNNSLSYTLGNGYIGGQASLTVNGSGGVTLASSNSYTGGTTLTTGAGVLTLGTSNAIGSGLLTVNGGTLNSNYPQSASSTAISGGLLNLNATKALGSGTLGMSGGRINLLNPAALSTSALTLSGGTLANASGAAMTLSNNNTQNWSGSFIFAADNGFNLGTGAVTVSNSPTLTIASGSLTVGGAMSLTSSLTVAGGGVTTFSGAISGAGGLTMSGPGSLMLRGANSYSGQTTVSGGTLVLAALSSTKTLPASTTAVVNSGGVLSIAGTNAYSTTNSTNTITVRGSGLVNVNLTGTGVVQDIEGYMGTVNLDSTNGTAAQVTSPNSTGFRVGNNSNSFINSWGSAPNTYGAELRLVAGGTYAATISASNTLTMAGPIDDYSTLTGYPLNLTGPGVVIFSGSNTYSGKTTISAGALQIGGTHALGSGAVSLSGGSLDIHGYSLSSGSVTLASGSIVDNAGGGVLSATGYLLQSGAVGASLGGASAPLTVNTTGTIVLSASNTFGGGTTISAGTLAVRAAGGLGSGSLKINPGTMLDVSSLSGGYTMNGSTLTAGNTYATGLPDINGSINLPSGATVSVAGVNTVGILAVGGSLGLSGANLVYDFSGGVNDLIAVNGPVTLAGKTYFVPQETLSSGTYTVMTCTGVSGAGSFGVSGANYSGRQPVSFQTTGGTVTMSVGDAQAAYLTWTGTASNVWDTTITKNWYNTGLGTADKFYQGDNVTFDDSASTTNISISGTVQPGSMTFNNSSKNYTLGVGHIGGGGGLSMNGAGNVTLTASNSYSGGTTLGYGAGVLTLNAANAIGNGPLTLNGGTVNANYPQSVSSLTLSGGLLNLASSLSVAGGSTLTFSGGTLANTSGANMAFSNNNPQVWGGSFTIAQTNALDFGTGAIALSGYPTVTVTGGTVTVGGQISDSPGYSGLTIAGAGTTILAASNSYQGGTTISGGLVVCGAKSALGAFNTAATAITINSGATLDTAGYNITSDFKYGLTISGSGTSGQGALINSVPGYDDYYVATPNITLAGDATVGGNGGLNMVAAGYAADTLDLAGHVLTKTGSGQFYLVDTTVTAGTVNIVQGTFGAKQRPGNASAADFVLSGGTLNTNNDTLSIGSLTGNSGTVLLNNTLTIGGDNNSPPAFAGTITGAGGLTKTGAGILALSGSNNYTGATTINGGTLQIGSANAIPHGAGTGNVTFSSSTAVLDVAGYVATVNGLSGNGVVDNSSAGTAALVVGDGDATTAFAGVLQNSNSAAGGLLALTKVGSGTLTLSGTNTYLGGTTVEGGTLILSNNEAIADGTSLTVGDPSAFAAPVVPMNAPAVAPVPEPSTLVLLAAALAVAGLRARRKRSYYR